MATPTFDIIKSLDTLRAKLNAAFAQMLLADGSNSTATTLICGPLTVATLPAAASVGAGARAFVTDSSATLATGIGNTVVGGGANKVPVYSDAAAWKIG